MDHILLNCTKEVLVTRLLIPLNTLEKIFVVVPQNAELEAHFPHWLNTLKTLANQTTGKLHFAGPEVVMQQIAETAKKSKPSVEIITQVFNDWDDILILGREVGPNSLFVAILAREQTVSHQAWMKRMPRYLSKHFEEVSFLLIYPDQEHG